MAQSLLLLSSTSPRFLLPSAPGTRIPRPEAAAAALTSSFNPRTVRVFTIARRKFTPHARSLSIRCEQGTKDNNGLDVWLSRAAMLGFAGAITVELTTGKGVLENLGFTAPLPTLALALTGLVGVATAFFIFQSASRD